MSKPRDVKRELTEYLRELQLPAIRRSFEDQARQAEREILSYEQYLLELAERECQERREHRIARLLQVSKLPLEKTLENFDLKRLPQKAARQVQALLFGAHQKLPANARLELPLLGTGLRTRRGNVIIRAAGAIRWFRGGATSSTPQACRPAARGNGAGQTLTTERP